MICFHHLYKLEAFLVQFVLSQIQTVLDREHEIAKAQLSAGRKDAALRALRQRKYQESLLLKTYSQLETLEQLVCLIICFFGEVIIVSLGSNYRVFPCRGLCAAWPQTR